MNFTVESTESSVVIKNGNRTYTAGKSTEAAQELVDRLNNAHRPNVEQYDPDVIYVCWNEHEKGEDCEYTRMI